jgi:cation diffusion facilitator family transporter
MTSEPLTGEQRQAAEQLRRATARAIRYALRDLLVNVLLTAAKIVGGWLGHSHVLIADGLESLTDVVGSLVVTGGLRIAGLPPDKNHPFGHGKAETLAALALALGLVATAAGITVTSIHEITGAPHQLPEPFTLYILIATVVAKELMYRMLARAGRLARSEAVKAAAAHNRSDVITSAAAFIGISIALVGGEKYAKADGWAALVACSVIAWNGVQILRRSLDDMMDKAAPPEIETKVRKIAGAAPGVEGIEKCRVRRSGLSLLVDIHVEVDGELSVRRGHEIAHEVKQALLDSKLGVIDVTVHIEPAEEQSNEPEA